jgi:hypothetical protein
MTVQVVADWYCGFCEVHGRGPGCEPRCCNCQEVVTVTAWSLAPVDPPESGENIEGPCHSSHLPPAA